MAGLVPKMGSWAVKNSPHILTCLNAFGVVVTAATSVRAYKQSCGTIEELEMEDYPLVDKFKEVWPYWILPTISGLATIGCGLGSNKIHADRELAMIASYDILKSQALTFRDHAIEEIGKNKVKKIEHDMHATELQMLDPPDEETQLSCDVETGGIVVYDRYSGQYIKTTYEAVYRAGQKVNDRLKPYGKGGEDWVPYSDFVQWMGGEYSEACRKYGFIARPFEDCIDVDDMCDPHIVEYKGHSCTIVYLNIIADDKDFL